MIRTCPKCKQKFTPKGPAQTLCSYACHKKPPQASCVCAVCGTKFKGRDGQQYCGSACRSRRWNPDRFRALERAGYRCAGCQCEKPSNKLRVLEGDQVYCYQCLRTPEGGE